MKPLLFGKLHITGQFSKLIIFDLLDPAFTGKEVTQYFLVANPVLVLWMWEIAYFWQTKNWWFNRNNFMGRYRGYILFGFKN